ncbi:AtpZ/AtpI family protein [Pelagimonas varians]|uniref:ATP synthase protein I n=1 Tax=Pelagimonas varians TaxID=696760 RepID=A0A238KA59_9RHOB|nr:AtpZ/AtpI family protein [Pelagimonas varians]PYG31172.1 ATP synthase protein I [Pelagimonas varians]SMX39781.1 ATP synthase protein I [Pelagimonas varians]
MTEPDQKQKLKELEAKIKAAKGPGGGKKHQEEHYSMANHAWRMVTELVAGLGIGFGIGYGLDVLAGTTPLFMVLFIMLGLAAGVNVMLRTAKEIQKTQEASSGAGEGDKNGD